MVEVYCSWNCDVNIHEVKNTVEQRSQLVYSRYEYFFSLKGKLLTDV
jgi:uncharacterized protein YajQ (UPF0234 family)